MFANEKEKDQVLTRSAKRTKHETACASGENRNGDASPVKRCDFDVFLSEENSLYTEEEIRSRKSRREYVPSDKANAWQIKKVSRS